MPNIDLQIRKAARQAGVSEGLFRSLIKNGERSWKGWQSSPAGAFGPSQLMPGTAAGLSKKYGIDTSSYFGNLLGGAYYLREQLDRWGGNQRKAVASYNAGPGNVEKYGGVPPFAETQRYVKNVMGGLGRQNLPWTGQGLPGRPLPAAAGAKPPKLPLTFGLSKGVFSASQAAFGQIASGAKPTETLGPMIQAQTAQLHEIQAAWNAARVRPDTQHVGLQVDPSITGFRQTVPPKAMGAIKLAKQYLGTPYVWGGSAPGGFDCSGLLQYVWGKQGVSIPRTTYEQIKAGLPVPRGRLQPGDAVFFGTRANPHHVGMYIGNGMYIQAPKTGDVVKISRLNDRSDYVTGRRFGSGAPLR